jgi:regulator of PEP synthase PpsR (kinase-PPPase family)
MNTDDVLNDVVNGNGHAATQTISNGHDGNKAAAIRRAFQVMTAEAKPSDVVDYLKREHGIEVTAAYVSVVKGQLMKKINNHSYEAIRLARKLVKETGSPQNARNAIDAVVEEQERTASLRNLYEGQLAEIDLRLDDDDRALDPKDRRELTMEKKRIQRLLDALDEF